MTSQELRELQDRIKRLQKKKDKAEGAREQLLEELRKEFKVNSIEEAEKLEKELSKKVEELEEKVLIEERKFNKKWQSRLED